MMSNRMRNIHSYLISEYGRESVGFYWRWEKFEYKMADFKNHRQFSLRCLNKGIIPTSVKLKTNLKTPKAKYIIKKAEISLLNERIRSINNSIAMFEIIIDTCKNQLESLIDEATMEECHRYIERRREQRHQKTKERHLSKFYRLCQGQRDGHSNPWHGNHGIHTCINADNISTDTSITHYNDPTMTPNQESQNASNSNINNNNNCWVRNFSKTPLTEAENSLLSHGPNFVIVPREPPTCEYIVAMEKACLQLTQGKVEELRGEVKSLLRKNHKVKPNISREEHQVLREMKRDKNRMVLTADKGVLLVVLDQEDYTAKSEELLNQSNYRILKTDPTTKHKNKLINLLKSIKAEGGIDDNIYRRLYPTGAVPPKYYGLPKVHKPGMPLRPIISSVGSVTHATAKELTRIIKPLVGGSSHHVQNNQDFLQSIEGTQLKPEEEMMSFDVEALFTSVPVDPSIEIIKKLLEEDRTLHQRTSMTVDQIICLLRFCLTTTYFTFQGKIFEQVKGAAMGSPISPIVANLFMEDLETKALATSPAPPTLWKRYVDDTFIIIHRAEKNNFLQHLNSIDDNIHFTCKEADENGAIAFLDMLITPDEEGRLNTSVYRKATHTDQYLHWDSHHAVNSKYSVVGTLFHRARTICSTPMQLQKEEKHLHQSLKRCKYPDWAINRVKLRSQASAAKRRKEKHQRRTDQSINTKTPKPYTVVPYHQGLSESYKNICRKYGIDVHLKGGHTIKDHLMAPKDKDPLLKKSGVIYRYKCDRVDCEDEYIGESARNFEERYKEHLKAPSPIHDHVNISGHNVTIDNFTILGREDHSLLRTIKEALYIRANNPSLNRNIGKYHLPHIWDEVLLNISELNLK